MQLESYLSRNNLREVCQSAYRKNHSTKTALLSVSNGLLNSADERLVPLLILLDLSFAFDTLDEKKKIMSDRLSLTFGIHGTTLKWFISCHLNRTQSGVISDVTSSSLPFLYGVPQGSVLGPILFTLYTQPLTDVINDTISITKSLQMTLSYTMPPIWVTFVL